MFELTWNWLLVPEWSKSWIKAEIRQANTSRSVNQFWKNPKFKSYFIAKLELNLSILEKEIFGVFFGKQQFCRFLILCKNISALDNSENYVKSNGKSLTLK